MSLETLLVLAVIFMRTIGIVGKFQKEWQSIAGIEYRYKFIDKTIKKAKKYAEYKGGSNNISFNKNIELKNVSFSYDSEKTIFKDTSLNIPKGKFVCLIGPSGIGKTTLIDILVGLLHVKEGSVCIDGIDIKDIDIPFWRNQIGYVPQDVFLFHDTLYKNVMLDDPNVSRKDTLEALKKAGMMDFVNSVQEGMDIIVGERGTRLSGGQRQRISIARALVRQPKLLILDEATSSLDERTEAEIAETVSKLKGNITILAITHRPALKKYADMIYTIDNNNVHAV